jgi:hypothetical protein
MLANRIVNAVARALRPLTDPAQYVTTAVGGCLVTLTFGLLLWPLGLLWIVLFMGPLLATSWLWDRAPLLRLPLGILGVPAAILGGIYVGLMPARGEFASRPIKLLICWTWPFSLDYLQYQRGEDLDDERLMRIQDILEWHRATAALAPRQTPQK